MTPRSPAVRSEERLIPLIRAAIAQKLAAEGFQVRQIAGALNVTSAAVTQYIKRRRGANLLAVGSIDHLIDPISERVAERIRSGSGSIGTLELLETARQVMVMSTGRSIVARGPMGLEKNESLELLRQRLQLELAAAES